MNKKTRKLLPYAILGVSFIALLAVFVAFLFKGSSVSNKNAEPETELAMTEESVASDNNAAAENSVSASNEVSDSNEVSTENEAESENGAVAESSEDKSEDDSESEEKGTEKMSDNSDEESSNNADATSGEKVEELSEEQVTEASQSEPSQNEGQQTQQQVAEQQETSADSAAQEVSENPEETVAQETSVAASEPVATPHTGGHLVVIDPGHQAKAMTDKEPNGPGSDNMKMKVTAGTAGKTTGLSESQLNLTIGLMLKAELESRGYNVLMTRESQDVSLSNVDRAQIANSAGAEAFIRIHANGSDNTSVNGALTICQTPSNPYNGGLHDQSRRLSDCVLDAYCASTGFKKQYVWETDTMTGINWANVPSTIIEMGYMSNPTDDTNMASPDYQRLMTVGIANGIDNYFAQ
ncbi:N-acetylmuramoyl-L-alanine amidase [Butyrivibrio sp. VCD2006]|uniref:N-acetylmuramoyl-L-alanine amidase n=1 Tax=Butyrivibrio sp. VCD2006 TaxID=1280664 RepID=UPI0004286F00|nr:N-acetylmuramoyl-L-alanine amidase [Butyrivibrio sp. VCD2006]